MSKMLNKILCIKSELLFDKLNGKWDGLKTDNLADAYKLLVDESEFRPRGELEEDPNYKQIIPQIILKHQNKYFLHKIASGSEQRLTSLCPLPLGGHVEEFDIVEGSDLIQSGLLRELDEEVAIKANIVKKDFLGLIYIEDENPVNHVHVGLLYVFELDNDDVELNEEGLEKIGWVDADYLKENIEKLTYWSRVFVRQVLG